jgi:N-acetylglucosaminyldiphosphoundecaprenol N-acetyl-beta-D-mannosaminyltransferase
MASPGGRNLSARIAMREAIELLGVRVDRTTWPELREEVAAAIARRERRTIGYVNVHVLNSAAANPALRETLNRFDHVYCDGEGVRIGARIAGAELPERMTGADFVWDLAARLAPPHARWYWLGGAPEVAAEALRRLQAHAPGIVVAGAHHGFFERSAAASVVAAINAARPDLLFVGMGTPIQELWVAAHRDAIEAPVVWCIGAAADFIAGTQRRAPAWMNRHGLEWLGRLAADPRRLFGRYVIGNPLFLGRVLRQRLAGGKLPPRHRAS